MMLNKNWKSHIFLFVMLIINMMVFLSSRYTVQVFGFSTNTSRFFAFILYLPFILAIFIKAFYDINNKRFNSSNAVFYVFIIYYALITLYRIFNNLEAKESIYYTVTILGTFSCIDLIFLFKKDFKINVIINDLCVYASIVVLSRLVFIFWLERVFLYSPINDNIISLQVLILIPLLCYRLIFLPKEKNTVAVFTILIGLFTVGLTLGSRAGFYLLLMEIIIIIIICLSYHKSIMKICTILLTSILLIFWMFIFDVSDTRYSIERQMLFMNIKFTNSTSDNDITVNINEQREKATGNVVASDSMRSALQKKSIKQVKLNYWFGTGDLYYEFKLEGFKTFLQTAHNIILETLNCYGICGLFLILMYVILVFSSIIKSKYKMFIKSTEAKFVVLLSFVFLANSFVQPLGYDVVTQPLIALSLLMLILKSEEAENKGILHETKSQQV